MYNIEIETALKQLAAQEAEDQKAAKDLEAAKKKQDDSELAEVGWNESKGNYDA